MFRNVPECSGMFRNVPCSGFYRRPYFPETVPKKRQISRQVGIGVFVDTKNELKKNCKIR